MAIASFRYGPFCLSLADISGGALQLLAAAEKGYITTIKIKQNREKSLTYPLATAHSLCYSTGGKVSLVKVNNSGGMMESCVNHGL